MKELGDLKDLTMHDVLTPNVDAFRTTNRVNQPLVSSCWGHQIESCRLYRKRVPVWKKSGKKFTTQHDLYQWYQNNRVVNFSARKFLKWKSFRTRSRICTGVCRIQTRSSTNKVTPQRLCCPPRMAGGLSHLDSLWRNVLIKWFLKVTPTQNRQLIVYY